MKKILLLTTGGTIASTGSDMGLLPTVSGDGLLARLGCAQDYDITVLDLLSLDSSNIQPEEWQLIARTIFEKRKSYDGIVITHGTDTMAYTASMLSFILRDIDIPVVLTGSQLPIAHPLSDAPDNLRTAFAMDAESVCGIFVAFDRKIMLGCRAAKVRTTGFNAFESVNLPLVGEVSSDGLVIRKELVPKAKGECKLMDNLDTRVTLIKLIPGLDPKIIDALVGMGTKGIVFEAFGSGGLAFVRRDLISAIGEAVNKGVSIVVCSQCLYERSDMTTYEVGRRALEQGVIPGADMTSEAAVTKLMWALGNSNTQKEVAEIFGQNLIGEVTCE